MSAYQEMMIALRESQTVSTKREAGLILAEGGWAVFPVPNNQKFDTGQHGLSYLSATTDPSRWDDMAESIMYRHECHDVNIALTPGKCAVPLIVVDLDGAEAIQRFFDEAMANGHLDLQLWLRANTTRVDYGRHLYFVAPGGKQWSNSHHKWGGDVRSGRGHVIVPPSTTELGRYSWVGEKLYEAPAWVVAGLRGGTVGNQTRDGEKSSDEISKLLEDLSQWNATGYGRTALNNMLSEMRDARAGDQRGGRNPALSRTVNRVMDLAVERHLNALESVNEIADEYVALFSPDEGRNPLQEVVRCVNSWMRNHETVGTDVAASGALQEWANARGGGATQEVADHENVIEIEEQTTSGTRRRRRYVGRGWKDQTNK